MTWNFRLVKHKDPRSSSSWYGIHEVFYNEAGQPFTMTEEPVDITGQSPREVREYLRMIQWDIKRLGRFSGLNTGEKFTDRRKK